MGSWARQSSAAVQVAWVAGPAKGPVAVQVAWVAEPVKGSAAVPIDPPAC